MPSYQRLRVPRWMHGANAKRLPVATTMTATVINERASTEPLSHRRPSWSGRTRHPHPRIARKGILTHRSQWRWSVRSRHAVAPCPDRSSDSTARGALRMFSKAGWHRLISIAEHRRCVAGR